MTGTLRNRIWTLRAIAALTILVLLTGGCSRITERAKRRAEAAQEAILGRTPTLVARSISTEAPSATPKGTSTPTASRSPVPTLTPLPTETPEPTVTSSPQPTQMSVPATPTTGVAQAVPSPTLLPTASASGTAFTIELTEEQLNGYLNAEGFSGQGVTISDVSMGITPQEMTVSLRAAHADTGLRLGVILHGQPKVIDGVVYLQIARVELDDSVKGLTRVLAQSLVQAALDQYAQPNGIPITIENAVVEDVQLVEGKLIVSGRTKG